MQTNRKTIGFLVILIGLIIIAVIIYLIIIKKTPTVEPLVMDTIPAAQLPPTLNNEGTTTPSDRPLNNIKYDISAEANHKTNATDLAKRAGAYAERFGSYSTQSDYGNFTDLKIYMTASLQAWVDNYVMTQKVATQSDSYYGITTKVLTTEVKSFNDTAGTANIIVTTERRESTESIGGGEPFIQKLDLSFLKVNGNWLMDKAYWMTK